MSERPPRMLALIVGGTSGLGLGIAQSIGATFDLALAYGSNHSRAQESRNKLKSLFSESEIQVYPGVLTQPQDCQKLFASLHSGFRRSPDILINCAGRHEPRMFLEGGYSHHAETVNAHLLVPMALCDLALPKMRENGFGRIINFSSVSARTVFLGHAGYAAAKAGIEAFTRCIAIEYAQWGITANCIAPGLFRTPMTENLIQKLAKERGGVRRLIPGGQVGNPEDLGGLVSYLCSPQGGSMNGSTLTVDGGLSIYARDLQ